MTKIEIKTVVESLIDTFLKAGKISIELRKEGLTKQLKEEIEYKQFQIDSLCNEIDTLQWETEIWDYNVSYNTTHLLSALIMVESRNNDSAHAVGEDAVGCLQIRKTMVDDVNRILKRPFNEKPFVLLVVGYPSKDCRIPIFGKKKKKLRDITTVF